MKTPPQETKPGREGTRITVTLPDSDYTHVRQLAAKKKVSASWIIRDAVERYLQTEVQKQGA